MQLLPDVLDRSAAVLSNTHGHGNLVTEAAALSNTHCHGNLVTEGGGAPLDGRCYSVGPPVYSWDQILIGGLSNIPDIEASSL